MPLWRFFDQVMLDLFDKRVLEALVQSSIGLVKSTGDHFRDIYGSYECVVCKNTVKGLIRFALSYDKFDTVEGLSIDKDDIQTFICQIGLLKECFYIQYAIPNCPQHCTRNWIVSEYIEWGMGVHENRHWTGIY